MRRAGRKRVIRPRGQRLELVGKQRRQAQIAEAASGGSQPGAARYWFFCSLIKRSDRVHSIPAVSHVRSPAFRRKGSTTKPLPPEGGTTNLININKIVRRHQHAAQALPRLLAGIFARELPFEFFDVLQSLIDFALVRTAIEDARIYGFDPPGVGQFFLVDQRLSDALRAFVQEFAVEPEERLGGDI